MPYEESFQCLYWATRSSLGGSGIRFRQERRVAEECNNHFLQLAAQRSIESKPSRPTVALLSRWSARLASPRLAPIEPSQCLHSAVSRTPYWQNAENEKTFA